MKQTSGGNAAPEAPTENHPPELTVSVVPAADPMQRKLDALVITNQEITTNSASRHQQAIVDVEHLRDECKNRMDFFENELRQVKTEISQKADKTELEEIKAETGKRLDGMEQLIQTVLERLAGAEKSTTEQKKAHDELKDSSAQDRDLLNNKIEQLRAGVKLSFTNLVDGGAADFAKVDDKVAAVVEMILELKSMCEKLDRVKLSIGDRNCFSTIARKRYP